MGDYWDTYLDMTAKIKLVLDENDITIPFPQLDVHIKNETPQKIPEIFSGIKKLISIFDTATVITICSINYGERVRLCVRKFWF